MCAKVRSAIKPQLLKRSSPRIAQQSASSRRESNDDISQTKGRKTSKFSFQQTSIHRRQTRNQSTELMSCITAKSVILPSTTNMSIRGTPKPRHAESGAGTQSNDVVSKDNDFGFDYLGRPPSEAQSDSDDESKSGESENNTNNVKQRAGNRKKLIQIKEDSDLDSNNDSCDTSEDTTRLVIPQLEFQSLVRQIMHQQGEDFHMQSTALECLQAASEQILIQYFEDINSVSDTPKTLVEAQMKTMIMDFYLNFMQQNK